MSFAGVGCATAIIYFSIFGLMFDILRIHPRISVSVAYFISVAFHFSANRLFVFQAHTKTVYKDIFRYLCVLLLNYLITITVVEFVSNSLSLSPYFGVLASVGITVMTGFVLMKFWVFQSLLKKGPAAQG